MPAAAHFDRLLELLELEWAAERERFSRLRASLDPRERVARGVSAADLELVDERWGVGGRLVVELRQATGATIPPTLGAGARVALRPPRATEDAAVEGVIARATETSLRVVLDGPLPVGAGDRLWLDWVADEVTFQRARDAVRRARGWSRGEERRKQELLVGLRAPRLAEAADPVSDFLNHEQREAAARALAAEDFFLIHGPPGTGKSTVLGEIAAREVEAGRTVLAVAGSNAAVDRLLEVCVGRGLRAVRVGHPARVSEALLEHTLDAQVQAHPNQPVVRALYDEGHELLGFARRQREQGRARDRFQRARDARGEGRSLLRQARELERQIVDAILDRAQVICVTCTALAGGQLAGRAFDVALFDEATQVIEPLAMLPWERAAKVILAGDHLQLPPTVLSPAAQGLERSLFERLLELHGPAVATMLREQHRMHEHIMAYPSRALYGGALRRHPGAPDGPLALAGVDAPPLLFLDTAGKGFDEERPPDSDSLRNPGEADLLMEQLRALVGAGLPGSEIAVLSPYAAQVALLRERLRGEGGLGGVEVGTVDAFQGREKEAVLVSLVRSNLQGAVGFLADRRRMNVAITRAKRHLFLVGDAGTLASHPFTEGLIAHATAVGGYRTAWEWEAITGA